MESIAKEGTPLDLGALDQAARCLSSQDDVERKVANDALAGFVNREDGIHYVDQILDSPDISAHARFFGCVMLHRFVKFRWRTLSPNMVEVLKEFVPRHVIDWSQTPDFDQPTLRELNMVLVVMIAREWPQDWPDIVEELIASSRSSPSLCVNNLLLITELSREIMEFGRDSLTTARVSQLTVALQRISPDIYELIDVVLGGTSDAEIINVAIRTLGCIVKWLDPHFIFESQLPVHMCNDYLPVPDYMTAVLSVFGEIASLPQSSVPPTCFAIVPQIFASVVTSLAVVVPVGHDLDSFSAFAAAGANEELMKSLIFTIAAFMVTWGEKIEEQGQTIVDALEPAMTWMLNILLITEKEHNADDLRSCCEMWCAVCRRAYTTGHSLLDFYSPFFAQLRRAVISKMERPEDIHMVESDEGEIVREEMRNTITIELYKVMKETLVYLTNLSSEDTLRAMQEKIDELHGEGVDFVTTLNALSWSAGAISGALPPGEERTFVITILRELFEMNQKEESVKGRTYLAENIMFVCSQFPRFLSDNWAFMKLVIEKLFEFMQHEIDDVREMAVHTYRTITTKCRRHFLVSHGNEPPIIDDLMQMLEGHVSGLKLGQIVEMYGAMAVLVAGNVEEGVVAIQTRTLMEQLNGRLTTALEAPELHNVEWLRTVAFIMRCNAAVIQAVEGGFGLQMDVILTPMVTLFPQMAALASEIVESVPRFDRTKEFRFYRDFDSSVLSILTTFVRTSKNPAVLTKSIVPILPQIVATFSEVHPDARVPETLQFVTALMTRLERHMSVYMADLWIHCFLPSVEMVRDDFESFPVVRLEIANFVEALVRHCQDAFFEASMDDLEVLVGMMNHGAGTPDFTICKRYLEALVAVIGCVEKAHISFKNDFYGRYYDAIICKAFDVLTDTVHKFAFTEELNLIKRLLSVQHDINDRDKLVELLLSPELYPRRPRPFYEQFVDLLRESVANHMQFRDVLRDFVIEVKEYALDDADLFREEMAEQQQERQAIDMQIPGLAGPVDPEYFE